ncbi:TetR family transcriptional regulator [Kineosporia sp. NBRC 101731]|uniref:TetR/AcrR family transcriptional regulator n=1 Tax=Kineosporia sp. NBRC 101731 TaxID=3032199 RepID=UPI0025535B97|nr:TetR family transcriptional regulator [Kineosporia sp. NBRC 101731]
MGRTASVDEAVVQARLAEVFRAGGYAGASLSALSAAVGLQRASLYHRFPDGKPAMARAVLQGIEAELQETLRPLHAEPDVAEGVAEMARRIARGYQDGRVACVLDTMTLTGAPDDITAHAARLARQWLAAMADASLRAGADPQQANARAQAALVRIQGALVVSRVLHDPSVFEQTLTELPALLLSDRRAL